MNNKYKLISAKIESEEFYNFVQKNLKKLDSILAQPFIDMIMNRTKNLVLSRIYIDLFIYDYIFKDKPMSDSSYIIVEFGASGSDGSIKVRVYGDNDFEIDLLNTPFTIASHTIKYGKVVTEFAKLYDLTEKDMKKAWDRARSEVSKFFKSNKVL